jgi:hypothetical protein
VATIGLGCLGYGTAVRKNVEISRIEAKIANLSHEFNGLTIAHLSDIHHGPYTGLDYINRCIEIVNGLNPDVIALTGDFTFGGRKYIEPCAEVIRGLRARVGVYAVLGNHDYYAGAGNVERALKNAGCQMMGAFAQPRFHRGICGKKQACRFDDLRSYTRRSNQVAVAGRPTYLIGLRAAIRHRAKPQRHHASLHNPWDWHYPLTHKIRLSAGDSHLHAETSLKMRDAGCWMLDARHLL